MVEMGHSVCQRIQGSEDVIEELVRMTALAIHHTVRPASVEMTAGFGLDFVRVTSGPLGFHVERD
jgi:hypothetical protein